MPAKKENVSSPLARPWRLLGQRSQSTALAVLLLAMGLFSYAVWCWVRDTVLASPEYWLTPASVEITPVPAWIRSDVRAEIFRDGNLNPPLSIMDDNLTRRVYDAFSLHPWVGKVRQVRKFYPARVEVDLVYRKPVSMVVVQDGLRPVDIEGVHLPTGDFCPLDADRYPRLTGITSTPVGPVGTPWGDPRVVGGAQIAAAFGPDWQDLKLDHIVATNLAEPGHPNDCLYEILTPNGTRILWGRAPGSDLPGEVPAADKVLRLKHYLAENGSLEGRSGPQELDVRSLRSMAAPRR
jgi:hypothetical protein